MPDLGTITGLIGAITGVSALVVSFLVYRQSGQKLVVDLRIQLRKSINEYDAMVDHMPQLIHSAHKSHLAVLNADGLTSSGGAVAFKKQCEADLDWAMDAAKWRNTLPGLDSLDAKQLESHIGDVHMLSLEADRYVSKYQGVLAADDARRAGIRAERATITAARIAIPPNKTLGE